jgi:hypothetical protein
MLNKIFNSFKFFTIFLVLFAIKGFAQQYPVVAKVNAVPPYPVNLSDYANQNQQAIGVQLLLKDISFGSLQVRLKFTIEGSGILISNPDGLSLPAITLNAGVMTTLSSAEIAQYFAPQNLNIPPNQYSQPLTEGTYRIGVEVFEATTNRKVSSLQFSNYLWIVVNDPPFLNLPANNVKINETNPQNITFQWTPRHKQASNVEYEFRLVELLVPENFNGNIQNLYLSQPAYYETTVQNTSMLYGPAQPPLIVGRTYAYRVKAKAKKGLEEVGIFRNEGFSEIFSFVYAKPELEMPQIRIASTIKNDTIVDTQTQNIAFKWNTPSTNGNDVDNLEYTIKIGEVLKGKSLSDALSDAKTYTVKGKNEFNYDKSLPQLGLGKQYAVSLSLKDTQNKYKITNEGIGQPISFVFGKEIVELAPIVKLEKKSISGSLYWTFAKLEQNNTVVSGETQSDWKAKTTTESKVIEQNPEQGTLKKPAQKVMIKVFLDPEGTTLIGTATTSDFGFFTIQFAAEAIRGGDIPEKLFLKINDPFLGQSTKEVFVAKTAGVKDIGEWTLTTPTFRFNPFLEGKDLNDLPNFFKITLYREKALYDKYPILKNEALTDSKPAAETIKDKSLVKVAELKAGQVVSGLFYHSADTQDKLLVRVWANGAYNDVFADLKVDAKKGILQIEKIYKPESIDPYIHGIVKINGKVASNTSVSLALANGSRRFTVFTNEKGYYRIERKNLIEDKSKLLEKTEDLLIVSNGSYEIEKTPVNIMAAGGVLEKNLDLSGLKRGALIINIPDANSFSEIVIYKTSDGPTANRAINHNNRSLRAINNRALGHFDVDNGEYSIRLKKYGFKDLIVNFNPSTTKPAKSTWENELKQALGNDFQRFSDCAWFERDKFKDGSFTFTGVGTLDINQKPMPEDYTVNFNVKRQKEKSNYENVTIYEVTNGVKTAIGQTDKWGNLSYKITSGKGNVNFLVDGFALQVANNPKAVYDVLTKSVFIPAFDEKNRSTNVNFELNETKYKVFELTGIVQDRAGNPLERVNISYSGGATNNVSTTTGGDGKYNLKIYATAEEQYYEVNYSTNNNNSKKYKPKKIYLACSWEREEYKRDIVLELLDEADNSYTKSTVECDYKVISGLKIQSTSKCVFEYNKGTYNDGFATISGTAIDKYGNEFTFKDVKLHGQLAKNQRDAIHGIYGWKVTRQEPEEVIMTPVNGIKLFGYFPVTTDGATIKVKNGILSSDKLMVDKARVKNDFKKIIESNPTVKIYDYQNRNELSTGFRFSSASGYPYIRAKIFPSNSAANAAKVQELSNKIKASLEPKEIPVFDKYEYNKGAFLVNNLLFREVEINPEVAQLNSVSVVPMLMNDLKMSFMGLNTIKLEDDRIDNIVFDFTNTPRTITVGKEYAKMPFRDVFVSKGNIEVTFFNKKGKEGKIISNRPSDMTDIEYFPDGIKYSNYDQKEVLFTGRILNRVTVFGTQNAMIPGDRIDLGIIENGQMASTKTGLLKIRYDDKFYADNQQDLALNYSIENQTIPIEETKKSGITAGGEATVEIDPHKIKLKWEYNPNNDDDPYKIKLESSETIGWAGYIFRLVNVDVAKVEQKGNDNFSAILKINYNFGIPIIGGYGVSHIGTYDKSKNVFVRNAAITRIKFEIPTVLKSNLGLITKFDENGKLSGLIAAGSGYMGSKGGFEVSFAVVNEGGSFIIGASFALATKEGETFKLLGSNKFKAQMAGGLIVYDHVNKGVAIKVKSTFGWDGGANIGMPKMGADTTKQKQAQKNQQDEDNLATNKRLSEERTTKENKVTDLKNAKKDLEDPTKHTNLTATQRQQKLTETKNQLANAETDLESHKTAHGNVKTQQQLNDDKAALDTQQKNSDQATRTPKQISDEFEKDKQSSSAVSNLIKAAFRESMGIESPLGARRIADNVIENAEITVFAGENGFALSLSGVYYNKSVKIAEAAVQLQIGGGSSFRLFVGIPEFYIAELSSVQNIRGDFQIDFGHNVGFFLMMAAQGEKQFYPAGVPVFVKGYLRLAIGVDANTDMDKVESLSNGGNILSETAKQFVGMTSNTNQIVEKSLNQRRTFFDAIPKQMKTGGRFTGIFFGIGAGVYLGKTGSTNFKFLAGQYKAGIGFEAKLGILSDFNDIEVAVKAGIRAEFMFKVQEPFQADLLNASFDLVTFCYKYGTAGEGYHRFLLSGPNIDVKIGETLVGEMDCNDGGVAYFRACLWPRFTWENGKADGFQWDKKDENGAKNTMNYYCPIEW